MDPTGPKHQVGAKTGSGRTKIDEAPGYQNQDTQKKRTQVQCHFGSRFLGQLQICFIWVLGKFRNFGLPTEARKGARRTFPTGFLNWTSLYCEPPATQHELKNISNRIIKEDIVIESYMSKPKSNASPTRARTPNSKGDGDWLKALAWIDASVFFWKRHGTC